MFIIQIITIAVMFGLTYLIFQALGVRRDSLLYTKEEKEKWDNTIGKQLGGWFTTTNIVGTLTSLATAYLFFIGSSKLFGWFIFACSITIWLGSFVTNYFTKQVVSKEKFQNLFKKSEQTIGVIASIFWAEDKNSRNTSRIVKWVSLLNISAVIWLEFALFADIGSQLLGFQDLFAKLLILVLSCILVFYFILRYGLRGFVFADLFQSPMILIGVLFLLIGCSIALFNMPQIPPIKEIFTPILSLTECILFLAHVLVLNALLVLVTESHWLRLWVFGDRETKLQVKSLSATSFVWFLLMLAGFATLILSANQIGEPAIINMLGKLSEISPIFIAAFWIGGVAALFSTADAQVYSFLMVKNFDISNGTLRTQSFASIKPLLYAFVASILFILVFATVRYLNLPIEKIIFIIIPMSLNIFPAFAAEVLNRQQNPIYIIVSLILYAAFSVLGLLQPEQQFSFTLAAALSPLVETLLVIVFAKSNFSE